MKATGYRRPDGLQQPESVPPLPTADDLADPFAVLEQAVQAALETYSNVHRGSGHYSLVSTHLYEQARDLVLEYLGLDSGNYTVIFGTPRRAELFQAHLKRGRYHLVSSRDLGLPLGVRAVAVERSALPGGAPFQPGGGTARLVFPRWAIWARGPNKFESGTPAIINVIAFARALRLIQRYGNEAFHPADSEKRTATEILYHDELERYTGRALLDELRQTLIGSGVRVPTVEGAKPYINLDNGASTPTFTPIWDVVCQTWHQTRQVQHEIIQEVRSLCARALGASLAAYEVMFTSNTTEAINLVTERLRQEIQPGTKPVVLNTLMEHNSNELPWRRIPGVSLIRVPVDAEGFVDMHVLEALLREYNQQGHHGNQRIQVVAVSGASNVLGTFNDLAEISCIVHRYGARLLVDGAQMVAHRKIDLEGSEIDYFAFSAHKVYAPFGSGVLLAKKGLLHFTPAELELVSSSGEENVGGIAALGKALVLLQRIGLDVIQEEEQALTGRLLRGLAHIPGLEVYGIKDPASPRFAYKGGVIVFGLQGIMAPQVARHLAERGAIGVRSGCHCAHLLIKHLLHIPRPLALFQGLMVTLFPQIELPGLTRVSLGIENSAEDIDTLLHILAEIARQPRAAPSAASQSAIHQQMDDFASTAARSVYT